MSIANDFLKNEFTKRKTNNHHYSVRSFAKFLDLSPAQLSQMMSGKRTVTLDTLKKVSKRLGVSPLEYKKLRDSLLNEKGYAPSDLKFKRIQLQEDQFRFIADWYHLAILNLTKLRGASADPRWVAKTLNISLEQAAQALFRLKKLNIISFKPFKQIISPFEISSQVPSMAIQTFHRQILQLAIEKLETVSVDQRQYQSMVININPKLIPIFKKMIDEFLDAAAALDQGAEATDVYQLSLQFFPVTQRKDTTP